VSTQSTPSYPRVSTQSTPRGAPVRPSRLCARRRPTRSSCYSSGAPPARRGRAQRARSERRCGRFLRTLITIIGTLYGDYPYPYRDYRYPYGDYPYPYRDYRYPDGDYPYLYRDYRYPYCGSGRRWAVGPSAAVPDCFAARPQCASQRSRSACACARAAADRPFARAQARRVVHEGRVLSRMKLLKARPHATPARVPP
jgi:hypothetical protein